MAQSTPAMTPEEALQTVAGVRRYREQLTARAAGIVWIVWGLALALLFYVALPFNFQDDAVARGQGLWAVVVVGVLLQVSIVTAAAVATNLILRAHAVDERNVPPAWIAYVAGFGIPLAAQGVFQIVKVVLQDLPRFGFNFAPVLFLGALLVLGLAVLLRRSSGRKGFVAAAILGGLFIAASAITLPYNALREFTFAYAASAAPLAACLIVGLATYRQG